MMSGCFEDEKERDEAGICSASHLTASPGSCWAQASLERTEWWQRCHCLGELV